MSFIRNLTRRMSSSAAKILFTEIGLFGDGAVALTVGAPSENNLLKVSSIMSKATETAKNADANKDGSYLQYGPKQGSPRYREQVAKFLSEGYGDNVKRVDMVLSFLRDVLDIVEDVVIVCGPFSSTWGRRRWGRYSRGHDRR